MVNAPQLPLAVLVPVIQARWSTRRTQDRQLSDQAEWPRPRANVDGNIAVAVAVAVVATGTLALVFHGGPLCWALPSLSPCTTGTCARMRSFQARTVSPSWQWEIADG